MNSSMNLFACNNEPAHVLHITDMEGGKSFFTFINNSNLVTYDPINGLQFNNKHKNAYFIYGGDAVDHGDNDLAIVKALIDFKKRHPNNVFLIAGNREITKNRFKVELAPEFIRQRLINSTPPRWLAKEQQTVPLDYLLKEMHRNNRPVKADDKDSITQYVNSLSIERCQLIYLHWMLEKTMGCPNTFEYRRSELAKTSSIAITDSDVLHSFMKESSTEGLMTEYLRLANIAVIIPNTRILSMHGGLTSYNIGRLPGSDTNDHIIDNVHEWVDQYNAWFRTQINDWINYKPTQMTEPAYSKLDDVSLPLLNTPKSIMVADVLNKDKQYDAVPSSVSEYLQKNNIQVVLTGHQICGDYPALVRARAAVFINSDTGHDPRGDAIHVVEIKASLLQSDVIIVGTLSDKTPVTTNLTITNNDIIGDPYIGQILPQHRLIQCCLPNGDYRLLSTSGKQALYSTMSASDIEELLNIHKSANMLNNHK